MNDDQWLSQFKTWLVAVNLQYCPNHGFLSCHGLSRWSQCLLGVQHCFPTAVTLSSRSWHLWSLMVSSFQNSSANWIGSLILSFFAKQEKNHKQEKNMFLWTSKDWPRFKYVVLILLTSSTAQGGGGSFKNRKPIGETGCCESGMAERSHWWTERWLRSPLFLSLSLTIYLPTYLSSMYLSIFYVSISLSVSV